MGAAGDQACESAKNSPAFASRTDPMTAASGAAAALELLA